MSDLFSIYEDKFNTIINRVSKTIETFTNLSRGEIFLTQTKLSQQLRTRTQI